jgi:GGDEF domain-containing protein
MALKSPIHLFERAKARFGLDVEVFDERSTCLYPGGETPLCRLVEHSASLRQAFAECLATGAPGQATADGVSYRLVRVARGSGNGHLSGMVAAIDSGNADPRLAELWAEVVTGMVQTVSELADTTSAQKDQSRRQVAMLRFLRTLGDCGYHIAELARAVIHALAVWYDVEARVYQRDLKGDFVLFASLPGAVIDEAGGTLNAQWLDGSCEPQRMPPTVEWGQTNGSDVLLVPITADNGPAEWVLALIGTVPDEATPQIATLARILGVQRELTRQRRRERVRQRFTELVQRPGAAPEVVAQQVVAELVSMVNALGGALSLNRHGRIRSLAAVGAIVPVSGALAGRSDEWTLAPDEFVCPLGLARDVTATLEVRPAPGDKFDLEAALQTRTVAEILHSFLRGAESTLCGDAAPPVAPATTDAARRPVFVQRIEEELERAKRFDLHLSLVLIDIPIQQAASADPSQRVQDVLRRELRGSDVLARVNTHRVAALLTHTDDAGSHRVVERLRRRLTESSRAGVPGIRIGHAAFSPDCRTADALVARAARDAELVAAL